MKFIHAAYLHLDSPLRNLENYAGAPKDALRGATRKAFENLVNLAIKEAVELVLLAGDLYDGDWKDYNTGLFFYHQMSKLREANVEVVWLVGNHDAASEITKTLQVGQRLPNVHQLSEQKPDTVHFAKLDVAVHGQGFARKAVTDNLASTYPKANAAVFNIGLLHTSLDGRPGHDNYAPCRLEDLLDKGYDYWALGHIHQQELLHQDPWVAFSGNIQGRHIGETGAKGCLLVSVDNGKIHSVEAKSLDVLRWRHCIVDITGATDETAVLEQISLALISAPTTWNGVEAVRLEITGVCEAHTALNSRPEQWIGEIRAQMTDASNGRMWLEKIKFKTRDPQHQPESLKLLLHTLQDITPDSPIIKRLEKDRDSLKASLPTELKHEDWLQIAQPKTIHALQEDVTRSLLPWLARIN